MKVKVQVVRTGIAVRTVEVDVPNTIQARGGKIRTMTRMEIATRARRLAEEAAGDYEFSESSSEYRAGSVDF